MLLRALILASFTLLAACQPSAPQLIFVGGPILTVDPEDRVVEALAVQDGRILATGSRQQILALAGSDSEIVDLHGKTLLPGLIAAHEHPTLSALFAGAVDLSGFTHRDNQSVWQALRQRVASTAPGEWVYAVGLDPILVPDLQIPPRQQLDQLAPNNPVLLIGQNLHSFWANSRAFAAAGVDRHTPNPSAASYYQRDDQGELTGMIVETQAARPFMTELKRPWALLQRYERTLDDMLANGFTTVASLGYNVPPLMARYAALRHWRPRIRQYFYLTEQELDALPESPDNGSDSFAVLGVKLWADGSPYTGSMFSRSAYLDSPLNRTLGITPGSYGQPLLGVAALREKIEHYNRAGWQVAIHSQGDASLLEVARALEQAAPLSGQAPAVRLEHAIELPKPLMPELTAQGVAVSFHINHLLYYGDALQDSVIGRFMTQRSLPVRSAFSAGLHPTLHADSPMFPAQPFSLMHTAMLRRSQSGTPINPSEAIDAHQALRAMTINAAYQLRQDSLLGSLEPGKWADLTVVSDNPYQMPPTQLQQMRVNAVYLGGRQVYSD